MNTRRGMAVPKSKLICGCTFCVLVDSALWELLSIRDDGVGFSFFHRLYIMSVND